MNIPHNTLHLLCLDKVPILEQLQIEEALLRADDKCYCIINRGSTPAIVMGISGHFDELVDLENLKKMPMDVIRRYSGGGTVVVDENTLFVTFILNQSLLNFPLYPERILHWSEKLYRRIFAREDFHLIENDYAIAKKKFGGNAQYIKKDRFVHHTTFLWDYDERRMQTLLLPKKRPKYRESRDHQSFLCCLKDFYPSMDIVIDSIKRELPAILPIEIFPAEKAEAIRNKPHRVGTEILEWNKG